MISYKNEDNPIFLKYPNIVSFFDHNFEYFASDEEFFSQCILDFVHLSDLQNVIENKLHYQQLLNFINIYIKKNQHVCSSLNNSNFYEIIRNFFLSKEALSIDNEITSQLIDICSTCISQNYPITIFPLNLISTILYFIQIEQDYEILRSSIFFLYFLQSYRSCINNSNYLLELNALFDQNALLSIVLEIEKMIWLHIFHEFNYQNISFEEAVDLLYAIYTTISSFFLLKNIEDSKDSKGPFISKEFHQEIFNRIYKAINFIVNNLKFANSDFKEIDYLSVIQSLLYALLNFISFDDCIIKDTSSLSFDQFLLEMIHDSLLSINNELVLEIISRIVSINDSYFNYQDLFQSFQFLLQNELAQQEDKESKENDFEIQDEQIVILIYEIISKIIRNQTNLQSKSICIQIEDSSSQSNEGEEKKFLIPQYFILSSIKMMKNSSYSIKITMAEFISTLFIFGGNKIINETINIIDENNQIIQLFYDFLIYSNQPDSDKNDDDWRIKQMKISIKLIFNFFSSKEEEDYYRHDELLNDLYEYVYADVELFDLDNDLDLIAPTIQI